MKTVYATEYDHLRLEFTEDPRYAQESERAELSDQEYAFVKDAFDAYYEAQKILQRGRCRASGHRWHQFRDCIACSNCHAEQTA